MVLSENRWEKAFVKGTGVKKYLVISLSLIILVAGYALRHRIRGIYRSISVPERKSEKASKLETILSGILEDQDPSQWLSKYDPERAYNGFALMFFKRRIPILINMRGEIVHAWSRVRGRARMRLEPNGNLLLLGSDDVAREVGWDGAVKWEYAIGRNNDFIHHDLIRLENDNVLLNCRDDGDHYDYLLEVTREGEVVWEWHFRDHLDEEFAGKVIDEEDPTHTNSVQELPSNRWYDAGDDRFKPGNILVSARNLSTIFIIEKETGDVVWQYGDSLDHQHEALMTGREHPQGGYILVFNNGLTNKYTYRRSSILAIEPTSGSIPWKYTSEYFFSSEEGVEEPLPNGNMLISSSRGKRVFEITGEGEVVWEFLPPFDPVRLIKYPYDHCPQFNDLKRADRKSVDVRPDLPYIDQELYELGLKGDLVDMNVAGMNRKIIKDNTLCRTLFLPARATLTINYGLAEEGTDDTPQGAALFIFSLRPRGSKEVLLSMADTVASDDDTVWIEKEYDLFDYAYDYVDMCIEKTCLTDHDHGNSGCPGIWENPLIESEYANRIDMSNIVDDLPGREKEVMMKQLRALGYVD